MDSVEIRTPKHLLTTLKRSLGSPAPRGSTHIPPLGTPRLPPAAPGSPTKHALPLPPASALRQRRLRTPSPEPVRPPLVSLSHTARKAAAASPSKRQRNQASQRTEEGLPRDLPDHLHPLLERQKRAILKALQQPPEIDEIEVYGEDYPPTNTNAYEQLSDLLMGSVVRGEGNSCLLIGPSGSGKTQMVERAITALPTTPIVVRLSGYAQHNDRLAIREIAWQLAQQTGTSFLPAESDEEDEEDAADPPATVEQEASGETLEEEGDDDENPFVDHAPAAPSSLVEPVITLPPPSHLLALISMIPTLPRPTVIVLDGFDLFASHARQALLYCLLDTAQSCRTGTGAGSGMAVVGVTARVDTINILEKRVKSRFSGRMIRTACPTKLDHWITLAKAALGAPCTGENAEDVEEWAEIWNKAVPQFMEDERVVEALRDVYALTRDFQIFRRIMTCLTLELTDISPYPTLKMLKAAISRQRCPARYPPLNTLPYPAICLLIAQVHAQTSGHDVFTFEMLHDAFKNQVRTSQAAPVQIQGGGVGMAFERLVDLRIFLPAASPATSVAKEFALHRCAVDRFAVKKAVEQMGQLNLRKWLTKS
ncbi:hypothetical protein L226DRAFT_453333 [Lentinus tigrinus ALCF2SS1-7]|uniref:Uncharacterized protein n=1 Tax=Lentinus tigrinus ALCF2SS1-6 TaxID=1328759 RepID=A0A5C2STK4_9APHY|nr:hypothetical protein L227DRAFT_490861 [Lentinus tigrinus ALCF2SS1-6]RPD80727.1 hypothetical protein L226DRAFT_453333 [Lentinus tigrinus ALCF2SS1-7]